MWYVSIKRDIALNIWWFISCHTGKKDKENYNLILGMKINLEYNPRIVLVKRSCKFLRYFPECNYPLKSLYNDGPYSRPPGGD